MIQFVKLHMSVHSCNYCWRAMSPATIFREMGINYADKHMNFVVLRLTTFAEPSTQPCRIHPKGVHTVTKASGKVKKRAITDPVAERHKACQIRNDIWKVFILQHFRDEMISSEGSGTKGLFSKKGGPPGEDSTNNCMYPELFGGIPMHGIPVDCEMDDFEKYFEQYSIDVRELW